MADVALEGFAAVAPAATAVVQEEGLRRVELAGGLHAGIDPGLDGWWALLDPTGSIVVECGKLPVIEGKKRSYDLLGLAALFNGWKGTVALVTLETQQAFPGRGKRCGVCKQKPSQGASSTFQTGRGYGILEMGLAMAGLRREDAYPSSWKPKMKITPPTGLSDAERTRERKRLAIAKCQALYPSVDLRREPGNKRMKPDHNKAEAILLACFGYRRRLGVV